MATLGPELSRIRKDGTRTVVVRISHREQQRRIPTNLIVRPEDLSRDGKRIRNRSVKDRVDELLRTMYQALESIPYFVLNKCDIDTIKQKILTYYRNTEVFKLNFFDFGKEYAADITVPATRKTYEVALSALLRYTVYLGLPDLDVNDITGDFLQGFVRYIDMEPKHYYRKGTEIVEVTKINKKKGTSARAYMIKLSTIFDAAKLKYNDEDMGVIRIPRSPFERVVVKSSPSNGQKHLDLETLREMIHDSDANMYERAAIDLFVV